MVVWAPTTINRNPNPAISWEEITPKKFLKPKSRTEDIQFNKNPTLTPIIGEILSMIRPNGIARGIDKMLWALTIIPIKAGEK
ncbi:hypothetical protein JCM12298_05230 [Desulfothermus naphthae]